MRKWPFIFCIVQMHALVVILMGLACVVGRLVGRDSWATWNLDGVGMATSTGLAFVVLGLGVFMLAAKMERVDKRQKRR